MWPNLDFILTDNHYICYIHHTKKSQKVLKNCLTLMLYNDWTENGASVVFSAIIQNRREVSKWSTWLLVPTY